MAVTLDEENLAKVESQKSEALKDLDKTYDGMVEDYTAKTDELNKGIEKWVEDQTKQQNESYELGIKEIQSQKENARKDYLKEQSGAYVDWQKQSNQYGAKAEQQASMGMANSGYSESSQVSMYNTYQNRVAAAREAFVRADTDFNLAMDRAKLQNDYLLAEIAYKGLQERLTLTLDSLQYTNSLLIQKASEKRAIDSDYHTRWMNMYSQIKQQQQFDESMAFQREQFDWQKAQAELKTGGGVKGGSSGGNSGNTSKAKSVSQQAASKLWPGNGTAEDSKLRRSDEYTIDTNSVAALGYGPINDKKLDELVASGKVKEIVNEKTGVISFKKVNNVPKKITTSVSAVGGLGQSFLNYMKKR